jgi:hypothetical protein
MNESAPKWEVLPTETEIYILPSGTIVVADLPVELATALDPSLFNAIPETERVDHGTVTLKHEE